MKHTRMDIVYGLLCLLSSSLLVSCDCAGIEESDSEGKTCTQACSFYIECDNLETDYLNQCIIDCENNKAGDENLIFSCYVHHSTECAELLQCIAGEDDDNADDDDNNDEDDDDSVVIEDVWTDPATELTWQLGTSLDMNWENATKYCENLIWDDLEDWRLPTVSELRSLIRGCNATETGGSCNVADDCTEYDCRNDPCTGGNLEEGPGPEGSYLPDGLTDINETSYGDWFYWSASSVPNTNDAWYINFGRGSITSRFISDNSRARCVR